MDMQLGPVLQPVVAELCSFLRKASRPLRQASIPSPSPNPSPNPKPAPNPNPNPNPNSHPNPNPKPNPSPSPNPSPPPSQASLQALDTLVLNHAAQLGPADIGAVLAARG